MLRMELERKIAPDQYDQGPPREAYRPRHRKAMARAERIAKD